MEQDERAVVDPSEVNTEQGGEGTAAVHAGEVAGPEKGKQERVSEADNSVSGAASDGTKKQDLEVTDRHSEMWATRKTESEDREAFEDTIATHFEFRAAAAEAAPPCASLRAWPRLRGGMQAGLTELVAAGDAVGAGYRYPVLGASSSSGPAAGTHEHASVTVDGDQGAAPGDDMKLKRACSAPGATVAIATASPPDSYRRVPWRSRKQYSPKRVVAAAGASPSAAAPPAGDAPPSAAIIPGSTLPSASASGLRTESSAVIDASASSSSNRPPCRGRKQPRPEHFILEEAEAAASAKARRSDIVLGRFLSSIVHGSRATDSEWARNVMAEDAAVRDQHQHGREGFRIRDASRYAARALSRLRCASPSSSSPSSAPGEPGGSGRKYGVLAALGTSLALTMVAVVLVYIVGQSSEPGPSGEKPDE